MIEIDNIYNMDCIEGMKLMANGSVDAVIADLPYGVLNRSNKAAHWDRQIPLEALWKQYRRITKPGSPVILFAQGIFSARLMLSQPRMWRYNLVWRKDRVTGHLNANRMPLRQHEDIIVFYDRQPVYHPQMMPCPPPFVPTRHDTMRLRLTGKGQIAVRSIAMTLSSSEGGRVNGGVPKRG